MSANEDLTVSERLERAEADLVLAQTQAKILFAMLYSIGRGLTAALNELGIDPYAACADAEGVVDEAQVVLRDAGWPK
jgi:hypothetical protein